MATTNLFVAAGISFFNPELGGWTCFGSGCPNGTTGELAKAVHIFIVLTVVLSSSI
jgi:hypothetical protein